MPWLLTKPPFLDGCRRNCNNLRDEPSSHSLLPTLGNESQRINVTRLITKRIYGERTNSNPARGIVLCPNHIYRVLPSHTPWLDFTTSHMDTDPSEDPHSVAIEQLEQFGLSSYAAQTYVALTRLGTGTARDISHASAVPRTRVYDATEELHDRGLVDIQNSSPKEFWAISPETLGQTFERELEHRRTALETALSDLESTTDRTRQKGVWTVEGQGPVTERILEFIAAADEEIVYMTVADLLTDDLIDGLKDAADRGVSIKLGGVSEDVQALIEDDIPGATTFESLWLWSDTPAGRLLLVDGEKTLVSVLTTESDDSQSHPRSETAIWGKGETNSLVVVLKAVFTWRLQSDDET